jgi:uncharacterized membrane protein
MTRPRQTPLITASMMLGMGMGGFADGILFHQIIQSHSMLSAKVSRTSLVGVATNMFWDGIFHASTWFITAIGLALLWRAVRLPGIKLRTGTFVGGLALGWGLFNLVEGTINHHLLHLHHVTETSNHVIYDLMFLAFGAGLVIFGAANIAKELSFLKTEEQIDRS